MRAMRVRSWGVNRQCALPPSSGEPTRVQIKADTGAVAVLREDRGARRLIVCRGPQGSAVGWERVALSAENFEIVVKGKLTPTLVAAIEGFEVSRYDSGLTHLVGWVPDQARLHGLLTILRDLNIVLYSVNAVEPPGPGPGGCTGETDEWSDR